MKKMLAAVLLSLACISLIPHVNTVYVTRQTKRQNFNISFQHTEFWELTFWHNAREAVAQQKNHLLRELVYKLLIENPWSALVGSGEV